MAVFTQTTTATREFGHGMVIEYGTWNDANGDASGTLTAATQTAGSPTLTIGEILSAGFTSDGSNAVLRTIYGLTQQQVKILCTASDSGTYFLIGTAA